MADGFGIFQFLKAVAEMARGAPTLSVPPVWQRALLNASDPPRITCTHHEYDQQLINTNNNTILPQNHMAHRSFFFGSTQILAIRKTLPSHVPHCSSFDLLAAYIWRLRTKVLKLSPEEEVRCLCIVNLRSKLNSLPLGYYGNALAFSATVTTAGKLCQNPLSYAIQLIQKAKEEVTEEYVKSVANLMVVKGRPHVTTTGSYMISDLTKIAFEEVNFGWGKATYGGLAAGEARMISNLLSHFISFKNRKGEKGVLVPLCLPIPAMERFRMEFDALLKTKQLVVENHKRITIASAL